MKHTHECRCGATLTCSRELDRCAVSANLQWDCPACVQAEADAYWQHVAFTESLKTQGAKSDEPQQSDR